MKKTLAILLSMALVTCLIPVNALVAYGATKVVVNDKECYVQITQNEVYYNDAEQEPEVILSYVNENGITTALSKNDGYSVSYEKEGVSITPKDAGTYDILITPTGGTKIDVGDFIIKPLVKEQLEVKPIDGVISLSDLKENMNNQFGLYFGNHVITTGVSIVASQIPGKSYASVHLTVSGNDSLPEFSITGLTFDATASLVSDYDVSAVADQTYTGKEIKPTVTITKKSIYDGNEAVKGTLVEGEDYKVAYSNNVKVGEATIVVTGLKNYSDEFNTVFTIIAKSINGLTFEGKTIDKGATQPNLIIKDGDNILKLGTDYRYKSVESTSNKAIGSTISVTVEGIGNYSGTRTFNDVKILDGSKNINNSMLTVSGTSYTFNGSAQYPTVKLVVLNGNTVSSSYYTESYQKADGTSIAASSIKDVGTYKILVSGKNGYTGVQTKTFSIKPLDINSSNISASYTGSPSYNPVKLTFGSKVLSYNTDYDVDSYAANKTYYTVTGIGNFTGTRKVYIATRNLSNCTINFSDNRSTVSYSSTPYYPRVTAYDYISGVRKTLIENTDYTLTYKDSKNQVVSYCKEPGTYSVIVTGQGAYTGTEMLPFTINGTDIRGYTVTLKESSVNATGYAQIPVIVSVEKGYTSSLTSNDYTVSYQDANGKTIEAKDLIAPGTYKVVVTGKNGYTGSTYATFRIVGLSQTVTVSKDSYKVYPTSETFKITATASGEYSGFTYTSSNPAVASVSSTGYVTPKKVGRAVITVTAVGKNKYESASETVEVKVYPKKGYLTKKPWTNGKKGQMKVRARYQSGATKYQFRYSRDKNFRAGTYKTKTVYSHNNDKYTTQTTTITDLKRGYTYYFKVRAVYTDPVTGDTYYGSWSSWRSAKTI